MPIDLTPRHLQAPTSVALPEGISTVTGGLLPSRRIADRLAHFPLEVYDVSPESHLGRFMRVLLGDAGAAQVRKPMVLARLAKALHGLHFAALDRFYGPILGVERAVDEQIAVDAERDLATLEAWLDAHVADGRFRSRVGQLASAISEGPTVIGLEHAAEALLSVDCDCYEQWRYLDDPTGFSGTLGRTTSRKEFVIRPGRSLSLHEAWVLERVLRKLRPADSIVTIDTDGVDIRTAVPVRSLVADSTHWEVVSRVTQRRVGIHTPYGDVTDALGELTRVPWGGYQGEAWSYNADLGEVVAYTSDEPTLPNHQRVTFDGGAIIDYLPDFAFVPVSKLLQGRLSSDGQLQRHPYINDGLYLGRMKLSNVSAASAATISNPHHHSSGGFRTVEGFWSTPERLLGDTTVEHLELPFTEPRWINYLAFETARFPHRVDVEALVEGSWETLFSRTTLTSSPARLVSQQVPVREHPQHYGPGHWERVARRLGPVEVEGLRLSLTREVSGGVPPQGRKREGVAYSLGVRGLEVGYRIESRDDLPNLTPGDPVIASTIDTFGSRLQFELREHEAVGLLSGGVWRSEPQPVPSAVVSLYADVRADDGSPSRFEQIYLEPLNDGPTLNLYTSFDEPSGDYVARDDSIPPSRITETGAVEVTTTGLSFDDAGVANLRIHQPLDASEPWWVGVELLAGFASTDPGDHPVIDLEGVATLRMVTGAVEFEAGATTLTVSETWSVGDRIRVVVDYDPSTLVARLSVKVVDDPISTDTDTLAAALSAVSHIRVGGEAAVPASVGGFALTALVLKERLPVGGEDVAFLDDPATAVVKPRYPSAVTDGTSTALLRFHSTFTANGSMGFVGGTGDRFASLTWTPVPRSYRLRRGHISLPAATSARYLKLEFTSLVAQTYEMLTPIHRLVRFHPHRERSRMASLVESARETIVGQDVLTRLASSPTFTEAADLLPLAPASSNGHSPTEVLYAPDIEVASSLRSKSWLHGFQQWNIDTVTPRFTREGVHVYDVRRITHDTKLAYGVGLSALTIYDLDHSGEVDTTTYHERCEDDYLLSATSWSQREGHWTSGSNQSAVATSQSFLSYSPIEAVQFAAQQTAPIQVIPDDEFEIGGPAVGRRNLLTLNQASLETDTSGWAPLGTNPLIARTTDQSAHGSASLEITDQFGGDVTVTTPEGAAGIPVTPGPFMRVRGVASFRAAAGSVGRGGRMRFRFFDSGGTLISTHASSIALPVGSTGWTVVQYGVLIPSGAAYVAVQPQLLATTGSAGHVYYMDKVLLEVSTNPVVSYDWWLEWGPENAWHTVGDAATNYRASDHTVLVTIDTDDPNAVSGIESPIVYPSGSGRITAATRVSVVSATTSPVILQILDSDDNLLVESERELVAGEMAEWWVGYSLGGFLTTRTWGDLEALGTWGDLEAEGRWRDLEVDEEISTQSGEVKVRLVQRGVSHDSWRVDVTSLFDDPIVWEFSVNDGADYYRAEDIRNNPDGVLVFPESGRALRWRVSAYRPGVSVSGVQVRPWYKNRPRDRSERVSASRGGNVAPIDHAPPVERDPAFRAWHLPIPRSWFVGPIIVSGSKRALP